MCAVAPCSLQQYAYYCQYALHSRRSTSTQRVSETHCTNNQTALTCSVPVAHTGQLQFAGAVRLRQHVHQYLRSTRLCNRLCRWQRRRRERARTYNVIMLSCSMRSRRTALRQNEQHKLWLYAVRQVCAARGSNYSMPRPQMLADIFLRCNTFHFRDITLQRVARAHFQVP